MKYKLVALDIDGTLLNDQHELTENTKQTIREVRQAGGKIVLCTGRGPMNTLPIMDLLEMDGTMITHNGGATVNSSNRELLHHFLFSIRDVHSIIEYCRKHEVHFDASTPFILYTETLSEIERLMYESLHIFPEMIDNIERLKDQIVKLTMFGPAEILDQIEELQSQFDCPLPFIRSGDNFIDVLRPEATKGNALKQLADQWGIPSTEIIAIGNYYNDSEMIKFAGLGIAMDNSPDEIKSFADFVTGSNNEDGVHTALQLHYFAK